MVRIVNNQSDLVGIKQGEDWIFNGWPEPPQEGDEVKFERDFESASKKYQQMVEFVEKEVNREKANKSASLHSEIKNLPKEEFKKKYTVREMKSFAKSMRLKGYSKLKEDELIDLIYENN